MVHLTIGPIIGTVTDRSARILIEVPCNANITILLTSTHPSQQGRFHYTLPVQANLPAAFQFGGLSPNTRYQVVVEGAEHPPSSFKTFPENTSINHRLCFAFLSCNNYRIQQEEISPSADVWSALAYRIECEEVHMMIHLGDQVYGDDDWSNYEDGKLKYEDIKKHCIFAQAMELLQGKNYEDFEQHRHAITEMYRNCYRAAWSFPPARKCLANCPSLMMYDDHDMRDDLGDKPQEFDLRSPTRFIVDCGRRACLEYQRQLHIVIDLRDEHISPFLTQENHLHMTLGDYGIMLVDSRGAKVFNVQPNDPKPFLTSRQWQDIHQSLRPGGLFDRCKILVWATQIPIVFFPKGLTERIAKKADDFEGMWSYRNNSKEQHEMLEALWNWKNALPGQRQIYLAGGDVHLAGHSQIFKNNQFAFDQIICGPVANKVLGKIQFAVTKMVKEMGEELHDEWSYEHYGWQAACNVGLLRTAPGATYQEQIDASHLMQVKGPKGTVQEVRPKRPKPGSSWWKGWSPF